jgi:hypothetical protein
MESLEEKLNDADRRSNYYLNLYNVFELLFWYVLCVMLILHFQ